MLGFSCNTGTALGNVENLSDALSEGGKGDTWRIIIGAGSGAYKGYKESKVIGKNFFTGKDIFKIQLDIEDGSLKIFDVKYGKGSYKIIVE